MIPYGIAFINCGFLTFGSYLSRQAHKIKYPPFQYCIDFTCMAGWFYFVAFLYVEWTDPYPWQCIVYMSIAGQIIIAAFLLLNAAVLSGKGALAMAIS